MSQKKKESSLTVSEIQDKIIHLPGRPPAMLDREVAELFGVSTRRVNEQVKRNPERFPEPDLCFTATPEERSQIATSQRIKAHEIPHLPRLFTQEGCNMLPSVLNSEVAVQRNLSIVKAFTIVEREGPRALGGISQEKLESLTQASVNAALAKALPEMMKQIAAATNPIPQKTIDAASGLSRRERERMWAPIKSMLAKVVDKKERDSKRALVRAILIDKAGGRYKNVTPNQKDDLFLLAERLADLIGVSITIAAQRAQGIFAFPKLDPIVDPKKKKQ